MEKATPTVRDIDEPLIPARKNEGGIIYRGSGQGNAEGHKVAGDGIVEVIPVYDEKEDEEAIKEVAEGLEGYVDEHGIREKVKGKETAKQSETTGSLRRIINKVVETPQVNEKLPREWYQDEDYKQAIAKLIMKNYANFNFEESQITQEIEEMYG